MSTNIKVEDIYKIINNIESNYYLDFDVEEVTIKLISPIEFEIIFKGIKDEKPYLGKLISNDEIVVELIDVTCIDTGEIFHELDYKYNLVK